MNTNKVEAVILRLDDGTHIEIPVKHMQQLSVKTEGLEVGEARVLAEFVSKQRLNPPTLPFLNRIKGL